MTDLTLCVNYNCSLRSTCYRFQAEPKEQGQSYAEFKPDEGKCEHFIPMVVNQ